MKELVEIINAHRSEIKQLRAELEQARKERDEWRDQAVDFATKAESLLNLTQRYRDALERIASGKWDFGSVSGFARDALAGGSD